MAPTPRQPCTRTIPGCKFCPSSLYPETPRHPNWPAPSLLTPTPNRCSVRSGCGMSRNGSLPPLPPSTACPVLRHIRYQRPRNFLHPPSQPPDVLLLSRPPSLIPPSLPCAGLPPIEPVPLLISFFSPLTPLSSPHHRSTLYRP